MDVSLGSESNLYFHDENFDHTIKRKKTAEVPLAQIEDPIIDQSSTISFVAGQETKNEEISYLERNSSSDIISEETEVIVTEGLKPDITTYQEVNKTCVKYTTDSFEAILKSFTTLYGNVTTMMNHFGRLPFKDDKKTHVIQLFKYYQPDDKGLPSMVLFWKGKDEENISAYINNFEYESMLESGHLSFDSPEGWEGNGITVADIRKTLVGSESVVTKEKVNDSREEELLFLFPSFSFDMVEDKKFFSFLKEGYIMNSSDENLNEVSKC
jgi:hypothetical protein